MLKKMILFAASVIILAGCAFTPPQKKDTVLASYKVIVIRPLSFENTVYENVDIYDMAELVKSKSSLLKTFNDEFEKYTIKLNYFDKVIFSDQPVQGSVVVLPRISFLNGGAFFHAKGQGHAYAAVIDQDTGRKLGSVTASRSVGRAIGSTTVSAIDTILRELSEDLSTGLVGVGGNTL